MISSRELEAVLFGAVLDAEGPVLKTTAAALIDLSGMRPEDFGDPRVRVGWSIAARLGARRRPVDAISVFAAGRTTKAFDDGDLAWLTGLQAGNQMNRERVADLVDNLRTASRRRLLANALQRNLTALQADGSDLSKVATDLDSALRDVMATSADDGTGDEDVMTLADQWDRQEAGAVAPMLLPTGLTTLDEIIGGLPQNLTVICGLPSVGKSALLGSIIDAQLDMGLRVGLFGLEDGTEWLSKRIMAREMGMPVRAVAFHKRTAEQLARFPDVGQSMSTRLKRMICYRNDSVSISELLRRAAVWKTQRLIDVLYVDHGGEVDHTTDKFEDHRMRVAESYRLLRNFALRYKMPVVVLAHTGRPSDDNEDRPPRVTEIAESAYIERRARLVLGCWRRQGEQDFMRLTVLKQTEGEPNVSMKLARLTQCALIDRTVGERIDLRTEQNREAKANREKREADRIAAREAAKAATAKSKQPQVPMFGAES